jgi:hypothetical protein
VETSQFEAKKVALKQTKDGHVLTLAIHPDDSPDEILRDFVGARYMVVMVRLADSEEPMNREEFAGNQAVKQAGMVCRDPKFWNFLHEQGLLFEKTENAAAEALCGWCDILSRSELKTNEVARSVFFTFMEEFKSWKH